MQANQRGEDLLTDLSSGNTYGSTIVETPGSFGSMPEISIDLNLTALTDINAKILGDGLFAIGGFSDSLTTSSLGSSQILWNSSNLNPAAYLELTLADDIGVPAPAALGFLGLGAGFLAVRRRAAK